MNDMVKILNKNICNNIGNGWIRNCPQCNNEIIYTEQSNFCRGRRTNAKCAFCAHDGQLIGRIQTDKEKELRNTKLKEKKRSLESKKRYSISKRGKNNPKYGDHSLKSIEHRRKIRIGCINTIKKRLEIVGKFVSPRFNPIACSIMDEYGKKSGYNFQHAMNGGEYYIKELGYWVDGYDKQKNVVVEYYERTHERTKRKIKDEKRQKEIIDFLNCRFIIIRENGEIKNVSGDICR